jgi:RNA polymerase sigma factor (sigma-70 family)
LLAVIDRGEAMGPHWLWFVKGQRLAHGSEDSLMLDQQLLESFADTGDPSAFREIVDRHGPAVLRACRRMLHDIHEADDAFQATFLILVRRPPKLRDPELLGRWLVGVARRVSLRARSRGVNQSDRERRWASMQPTAIEQDWPLLELRRAVREELEQLPSKYRRPLALCYLEGLTHEEAAEQLDCPVGTVKVQLVRARKLLKERLDRRGVALGVAFLLFLLRGEVASAGVSSSYELLADSTVEVMHMASKGETHAIEAMYPRAFAMSQALLGTAFLTVKVAKTLLILFLLVVVTGGAALAKQAHSARAAAAAAASSKLMKVLVS